MRNFDRDGYVTHLIVERQLGDASVNSYRALAMRWADWCADHGHDPHDPQPLLVRAWSLTVKPSRSMRDQAHAAMKHLCMWQGVDPKVAKAVERPKNSPKPRWRALPPDVVTRLLSTSEADGQATTALVVGLYTGLRRSEIAALRWENVDLAQRRLVAWREKGDDWITLPIHDRLADRLAPRHDGEGWVFPGRWGGHISPGTLNHWMARLSDLAGVEPAVTPHQLRHTAASRLYDATRDLLLVKAFLQHARPETTARYVQVNVAAIGDALVGLDYGEVPPPGVSAGGL